MKLINAARGIPVGKHGRFTLPAEVRKDVGIENEVWLVGARLWMEIWLPEECEKLGEHVKGLERL